MKQPRIAKTASTLAALSLGFAALTTLTSSAASASPQDCASWPRPGSLPDGTVVKQEPLEGPGNKSIKLVFGKINGRQAGWAVIGGKTTSRDKYWFDVSTTGGNGNMQCGPFSSSNAAQPWWSPAHYTSPDPNLVFRACARAAFTDYDVCTGWV